MADPVENPPKKPAQRVFQLAFACDDDDDDNDDIESNLKAKKTKKSPQKSKGKAEPKGVNSKAKEKSDDSKSAKITVVVGVDFGTTYSGYATATSKASLENVKVNKKWPGGGAFQEKVPSIISYKLGTSGEPEVTAWGCEAKCSENTYAWFKLGLGKTQEQSEHDDELLKPTLGSFKCPDNLTYGDIATDYLCRFYQHFLEKEELEFGKETTALTSFHYVLAVPAGWPDQDRQAIKTCAIKTCATNAGFGTREGDSIAMIAEPEAAALAVFEEYRLKVTDSRMFKADTNVMVIDMGGGTVDLITYTIKKTKPFRVEEACAGSGAKCGSTTIDRRLHHFMKERFGEEFTKKPQKSIGPKSKFMEEFEFLKRRFSSTTLTDNLPLDMNWNNRDQYDSDEGEVILQEQDLIDMFKPVLDNVTALIQEQAKRTRDENIFPITSIILCGGLAENEYIQKYLKAYCAENVSGAEVLVPSNPWSAICAGAAMSEIKSGNFVTSRKSRRSYGTVVLLPFVEGEHDEKNAIIHPELGKRVESMYWHSKKHDRIDRNDHRKWLKNTTVRVGGALGYEGVIEIYACENDIAPLFKADMGVKKLGDLPIDLSAYANSPKKRKLAKTTWIPESKTKTVTQKIQIGQVILPKYNSVQFIARVGSKNISEVSFDYAPIAGEEEIVDDDDEEGNPDAWLRVPRGDDNSDSDDVISDDE